MSNAINSHGALMAIEKDGDPAGTFTTIAELMDFTGLDLTRESDQFVPHNDDISSSVFGPMMHGELSGSVKFVFDDGTHDHTTGLQKRFYDGDTFGIRITGPGGSAGSHELIYSGELTSLSREYPTGANAITMDFTFQPSGLFIVDGETKGSIA